MKSHGDVGSICDYLVIMSHSKVILHDDLEFVVESHRYLSASATNPPALPEGLTIVAAVFLPLTFFTGYFGMNFRFITHLHGAMR